MGAREEGWHCGGMLLSLAGKAKAYNLNSMFQLMKCTATACCHFHHVEGPRETNLKKMAGEKESQEEDRRHDSGRIWSNTLNISKYVQYKSI